MRSWVGPCFSNSKAWSNLGTFLCSAAISLETDGDLGLGDLTFYSLAGVLGHYGKNRDVCPHLLVNRGLLVPATPSPWGLALDPNHEHQSHSARLSEDSSVGPSSLLSFPQMSQVPPLSALPLKDSTSWNCLLKCPFLPPQGQSCFIHIHIPCLELSWFSVQVC